LIYLVRCFTVYG